MTVSDHRELVAALLAVDGVADASVEPEDGKGPGTLRLQLAPGADEVVVAGAVNRLLRSRFGLAVDADRVRVLDEPTPTVAEQAAGERADEPASAGERAGERPTGRPTTGGPPVNGPATRRPARSDAAPAGRRTTVQPIPEVQVARPGRLVVERVQLVSAGLGIVATVSVAVDEATYTGEAEGSATPTSVHRTVAGATVRAVEQVIGDRARFEIEHVEIAATGRDQTALVVVTMVTGRGSERLSGASVVRDDARQAIIRAVLAAVNRRLEPMLEGA